MKFINIVVHSTQNMNFRVHLQYELTLLGLDEFINKKLRLNENEKLQMEIQVYLDNQLDIEELIEDSELKNMKEKELENLTEEFLVEKDKFNDALNKITELQKQNEILMKELTLSKQLEIKKINDEREINENSLIPNPYLPGQFYTLDQQCMYANGPLSTYKYCVVFSSNSLYIFNFYQKFY